MDIILLKTAKLHGLTFSAVELLVQKLPFSWSFLVPAFLWAFQKWIFTLQKKLLTIWLLCNQPLAILSDWYSSVLMWNGTDASKLQTFWLAVLTRKVSVCITQNLIFTNLSAITDAVTDRDPDFCIHQTFYLQTFTFSGLRLI